MKFLSKIVFNKTKRDLQSEFDVLRSNLSDANVEIASLRTENAGLHSQVNQLKEEMSLVLSRLNALEKK